MNFCTNCGVKLNEGSQFCTGCGLPVAGTAPNDVLVPYVPLPPVPPPVPPLGHLNQQINIYAPPQPEAKTAGQTARLVIGIATLVLFVLFQIQSCAAMGLDFFDELFTGEQSGAGMLGYAVSFFFLIAGIVSIAARRSRGGAIAAGCIYAFCGISLVGADFSNFPDLALYCFLSFVFAGILIIGAAVQKPVVK